MSSSITADSALSPTSDFYLHPSESPTQCLVSLLLNNNNYHSWSRSMTMALRSKIKYNFVNRRIRQPNEDDANFPNWDRCNITVSCWIMNFVSASIQPSIFRFKTAHAMWKDLQSRFSKIDFSRISNVQEEIFSLKEDEPTLVAFSSIKGPKQIQQKRLSYKERQNLVCTHYKKIGHLANECYRIVGFPPNYKFNKSASANMAAEPEAEPSATQKTTTMTISQDEYEALKRHDQANAQSQISVSNIAKTSHAFYGKLFDKSSKHQNIFWLLDTGASDHICCSKGLFKTIEPTRNHHIQLPNKHVISVTHIRTVELSNTITLLNVLYAPEFTFNLVFANKLTVNSNFVLMVYSSKYLMHDLTSMKMIGTAEQRHGLYYMNLANNFVQPRNFCVQKQSSVNVVHDNVKETFDVWHFRLGHPSNVKLNSFKNLNQSINFKKDHICDVCHFAKQKRLNFPVSNSVANDSFGLIHMDIWGPGPPTMLGHRTPTPILEHKTPFELLHNELPDLTHLRVFGSLCFIYTLDRGKTKFTPRSSKCVMLGYQQGTKGYKIDLDDLCRLFPIKRRNLPEFDEEIVDNQLANESISEHLDIDEPSSSSNEAILKTQEVSAESEAIIRPEIRKSTRTKSIPKHLADFHYN
ncbi:uncharacterized protein [Rutidosis leptorrhynchoides]|uniref:uncharacterized protein n=1 Tax=Rutidosis leptorrhynchoides TaxID=125765 RepID=UPI003A995A91